MTASRGIEYFNILSDEQVGQIFAEAIQTLEKIGILIENDEALGRLADAGTAVSDDGKRAFIKPDLVKKCIESAPGDFVLYDKHGEEVGPVGRGNTIFDPGSAAISIYDFDQRRIRKPLTKDVIDFVRLTDRLDAFGVQSTGVVPSDVPEHVADRYRVFLALLFGKKPIITGTFVKDAIPVMFSLLTAIRGDAQSLADKPLAMFDCCPTSPLTWDDLTCQTLMDCAEHGIPGEIVSMPLAGATGPVTLAGSLVQHTAEVLSGVVIHQTVNPGAPLVYGGACASFDMRKGTTPMGAVETMMLEVGYIQIARSLGLPAHVYMGLSDAKSPDFQAGFESSMGAVLAALAGASVVSGPGMLNFMSTQSLEKLVLDSEICAMAKRLAEGITFREKSVGFEILREAALEKTFLTSEHTRRFFKEEMYYPSPVVDRSTQSDWEKAGSSSAAQRAHERVAKLLQDPASGDLPSEEIIRELEAIMSADARKHSADKLPDWRSVL
jgi:trimethylamine--corrinoid protein Co-methyltransferase